MLYVIRTYRTHPGHTLNIDLLVFDLIKIIMEEVERIKKLGFLMKASKSTEKSK